MPSLRPDQADTEGAKGRALVVSDRDDRKFGIYVAPGAMFALLAGYMLVTGELPIDKHRTMIITRASNPLIYWPVLLVAGTIAFLCLRKIWKGLTGKDEG